VGPFNDDPPSHTPAAAAQPAQAFASGFAEEHRQGIFLGLAIAGTLLLGPFAINNFLQGRLVLGIASSTFVVCLLVNALAIARGRKPLVPMAVIFLALLLGLATAMYKLGLIGILWVYPGILLFHFMLPRRQANAFNATLVLLTVPMAWMHLGPQLTARVAVTLVLLVIFSNIFSRIADAQHAKEAQQRERLDGLVRQLEEQNMALREAFRMREEVERIARHDLKTPLASIASVPRLLRERHPPDEVEDELLGVVERAALRVLSMVNLSLDLFRMEEGTYHLRAQAVDMGVLLKTVARDVEAHALSKHVRLALDLPAQTVCAQGEELLCYSTLSNLVTNAVEASPERTEVRVTLRKVSDENGDAVAVDIHNAGEVPLEVRDRFFEKYATHGKPGGNGLGAYSARLMARVQRGSLRMASGPEGTTLSLRLPLWHAALPAKSGAAPAVAARPQWSADPLPPLSVLLVDDDEYNIVVLKSLLPSPPLDVRTAVNGRAALELVGDVRPDVIFLDLEMPVLGGIEAARRIRAVQSEQGVKPSIIAAFSAHDDHATRRQCLEAGFDTYLAKPASREEVFAVLRGEDPAAVAPAAGRDAKDDRRVWVEPSLMLLMPEFLSSRRQLAEMLVAAVEGGQRETIRVTAHQLAGSLSMYGFREAGRASRALEQAATTEDLEALRSRSEALAQMIAQAEPMARQASA
jgi:signal transduction histidine kinase/DNA-binding NarL/FixJ family response regulator